MTILLENQCRDMNGHLVQGVCADGREAASWVDRLNEEAGEERFGFCIDTGACSLCGQDMQEFALSLGKRTKAVILRECDGHTECSRLPFTCAAGGQALTDWLGLIRGLRETGFDGRLILDFSDTAGAFSPILRPGLVKLARSYMYHVGQYLPDWHPWESYQNFFAGDARTNGCREIFAIELPWLVTCFGAIKTLSAVGRKNTSLQVKYRDTYQVQICHENGAMGMLAVDVVSRRPVRKFEVYSEDLYLTWDGTPDSIQEYDIQKKSGRPVEMKSGEHREGYAAFITEDAYRKEIDAFLSAVHNRQKDFRWDFERDQAILHVIDEIEGQNEKAKTE